jgi:hypothetical protein
VIEV